MLCETGTGRERQKIVNPSQSCDRPTVHVSCTTGSGRGATKFVKHHMAQWYRLERQKFIKDRKAVTGLQGILCETGTGQESQKIVNPSQS